MTDIYVSYDGYSQKIDDIRPALAQIPASSVFVSYGRLVAPGSVYANAPLVELYQTPTGFIAIKTTS